MASRLLVLALAGLLSAACVAPLPLASDSRRPVPPDYLGLVVDTDLLNTSRLDPEDRPAAQELLQIYYSTEYNLRTYIEALEANLAANEQLAKNYATAEAIVGGVAGLSSVGVIFATAAIAAPVTGAVWIGISQYLQHYAIDPQIKTADRRLAEARSLLRLFPDVEKIFDGLVYAETSMEAQRRFKKWAVYVRDLQARAAKVFERTGEEPQTK